MLFIKYFIFDISYIKNTINPLESYTNYTYSIFDITSPFKIRYSRETYMIPNGIVGPEKINVSLI